MKRYALWAGAVFAVLLLALSVTNASWLAPDPKGAPKQVANGAIGPEAVDPAAECGRARIYEPASRHLPNTRESVLRADRMGAWLVEVDARQTTDGAVVLFGSDDLACLTDGSGALGDRTLAGLQALDAGHGYRVGEDAHPFRDKGHRIETLTAVADALPSHGKLMVHLAADDPAFLDAVLAALVAAGRKPASSGDAFYGPPAAIASLREREPGAWAFSPQEARQCTDDYVLTGWTGIVPESCENGTMLVALDEQAFLWGWPNRLIARLESVGARIVIEGPGEAAPGEVAGITLPEQLTEIPDSFNGYVWTDDAFVTLPALVSRYDNRNAAEIEAAQAALERRRAAQ
ncbi:glycerophosphodiester phosphodiesterase family protein [Qipengyuania nanhaisediminis]|uniref:glycerophosphodiester phosphodiesterase family protein n=1 Tax=Qipengyuania nanhaisediminis TaxID=604088 RepID=UPI0038B2A2B2